MANRAFQVSVAQIYPTLGDVARNLDLHREAVARAVEAGSDLVVFPELSLTGYFVKDLVGDLSFAVDHPALDPIREASRKIDVVLGFIEEAPGHLHHIAAGYFSAGALVHLHRKAYLPTYGMFEEVRFLTPGNRIQAFDTRFGRFGMLICEDLWHPSTVGVLSADGTEVLVAIAASPGRGYSGENPATATTYEAMTRVYAQLHGIHVVFANRVGFEDGAHFWGGSEIRDPFGERLAKAPYFDPALITATLFPEDRRRARLMAPMARDERLDLTLFELSRIAATRR